MMASLEETLLPPVDHIAPTVPISPSNKGISYRDVPSVPPVVPVIQKYRRGSSNKLKSILSLFFIVFVGVGALCTVTINQMRADALSNTHAFATATANDATATKTTAVSEAAATKTAIAASTATAQTQATATAIQHNPYPSYLPGNGQLALYDPLMDDSEGYEWMPSGQSQIPTSNGDCLFNEGRLDASVEGDANHNIFFHPCIANTSNFGNFAYEVHMTLLAGDCGGVTLRGNGELFYYFIVCQNGQYRFVKYVNDGTTPVILKDKSSPVY